MPTSFIKHKGVDIVWMNFAGEHDHAVAMEEIAAAQRFVAAQPRQRTLRVLVDVSGARWDAGILDALRKLAEADAPWVLASTLVGISPIARVVMRGLLLFTGRKIGVMRNAEQAKDWLVAQATPPQTVPDQS